MAIGTRRHYKLNEILPRHWAQTAALCKFEDITTVMQEIVQNTEQAIAATHKVLPPGFPQSVSHAIFHTLTERTRHLSAYL